MILPCLTLSNIRYVTRVKWSNPGKGVVPSPTSWYSSYWKGSLLVALDYSRQQQQQLRDLLYTKVGWIGPPKKTLEKSYISYTIYIYIWGVLIIYGDFRVIYTVVGCVGPLTRLRRSHIYSERVRVWRSPNETLEESYIPRWVVLVP